MNRGHLMWTSWLLASSAPAVAQRYDLQVRIDPTAHRMSVHAEIEVPADGVARREVVVRLATTMRHVTASIIAPPELSGSATLTRADSGAAVTTWTITPGATDRVFPARLPVRLRLEYAGPLPDGFVRIDPRFRVLHWDAAYGPVAAALAAATRADHLQQTGQGAAARAVYDSALASLPRPDRNGVEFNLRFGLGRLERADNRLEEARAQFDGALRAPSRSPASSLAFVYLELARIAKTRGDGPGLAEAVAHAVSADSLTGFYTGVGDQARALLTGAKQ